MHCFDQVNLNVKNDFHKPKQDHYTRERLPQRQKTEDHHSMQSREDDNDSLSSYQNTISTASQHPSRSVLNVPNNDKNKQSKFSLNCIQINADFIFRT
jgi:hypothetical protein